MTAKKTEVTALELDTAYNDAVARAGQHPNALGFMRRVPGSQYHRPAPNGRSDAPTMGEMLRAYQECRLVARVGRW